MSYTLLEIRQELARSVQGLVQGTATGGDVSYLTDASELGANRYASGHFDGADVYITDTTDDAAPKGEVRRCHTHDTTYTYLRVDPDFTAAPDAGDTYDLYYRFTKAELDQALYFALDSLRFYADLGLSANTAEYALSSAITGLHDLNQVTGVYIRNSTWNGDVFRPITDYQLFQSAGDVVSIEFGRELPIHSSVTVRIEYIGRYDILKQAGAFVDTATVGGDLYKHILKAQMYLYRQRMQDPASPDRDYYASLYQDTAQRVDLLPRARPKPGKVRTQVWEKNYPNYDYMPEIPDW